MTYTVGSYLASRLSQIGLKHHFAVAGDFNLVLLDQLLTNRELEQVYCCNELNCGYSAEGYARACGAAAAVVTFSVGVGKACEMPVPVRLTLCTLILSVAVKAGVADAVGSKTT